MTSKLMHHLRQALRKKRKGRHARRDLNVAVSEWSTYVASARVDVERAEADVALASARRNIAQVKYGREVNVWSYSVAVLLDVWLSAEVPGWIWRQRGTVVVGHEPDAIEPDGQSIMVGIEPADDGGFKWVAASVRWRTVHGTGESVREALDAMRRSLTEPVPYDDAWPDLAPLVEKLQAAVEALTVLADEARADSSVDVGDASQAAAAAPAAPRRPRGPGGRFAPRDPAPPVGGGE